MGQEIAYIDEELFKGRQMEERGRSGRKHAGGGEWRRIPLTIMQKGNSVWPENEFFGLDIL